MELLTNKARLFQAINIAILVTLAVFVYFDKPILGLGVFFLIGGPISIAAFASNTEPLWMGMGGFDYAMKLLFKEYYNRVFNLCIGLLQMVIGIAALVHEFR